MAPRPLASAGSATPRIPTRTPPTVSSRDGATFLRAARCCSRRAPGRHTPDARHDVGLGQARGERRPERPSASPRNVARAAFACFSLGVLLSGNDRPPASTSRTGPLRARGPHERRVAGDVAQRIAGAAARLGRAVDLGRVEERQAALARGAAARRAGARADAAAAPATAASRDSAEEPGVASGALWQSGAVRWQFPARRPLRA